MNTDKLQEEPEPEPLNIYDKIRAEAAAKVALNAAATATAATRIETLRGAESAPDELLNRLKRNG